MCTFTYYMYINTDKVKEFCTISRFYELKFDSRNFSPIGYFTCYVRDCGPIILGD